MPTLVGVGGGGREEVGGMEDGGRREEGGGREEGWREEGGMVEGEVRRDGEGREEVWREEEGGREEEVSPPRSGFKVFIPFVKTVIFPSILLKLDWAVWELAFCPIL